MLPVLFSIGPVTVYTFAFFLFVGFFLASFLIWRRLRDLGLEEEKVVDFLLWLWLTAFVFARAAFILTHFESFGLVPGRWFLVGRYPGFSFWGAISGGVLSLVRFCRRHRWDFWRVADEVSFGILPFSVLISIGSFFDGSILGIPTGMPWGVFFPGDFIRRQPVSLFQAFWFFLIWLFLLRIERHWRTWKWYKSQAEGFISLTFLGLALLGSFLLAFLEANRLYFPWFKPAATLVVFLLVLFVFYQRSGIKSKLKS